MDVILWLGAVGGVLYLITYITGVYRVLTKDYIKYREFYEEYHDEIESDEEPVKPIGFMTAKERKEIEAKLNYNRK